MQKYTDCFLYFQASCSWSHIVCFLTKMFHNSNKTWHIIQVRSPSTITQKFIYEFNLVTSTPKICENTAVKIFPVHVSDEPPHQIHSYTLLFLLFLHFLYIVDPPLRTSALTWLHVIVLTRQSHLLHQTDLAYLMDTWLMIHMYLLLFLVSPTSPLLQSNQSRALAPCSQALSITLPYAHFLVYHSYLTCLYFTFCPEHQRRATQLPIPVSPRIEI